MWMFSFHSIEKKIKSHKCQKVTGAWEIQQCLALSLFERSLLLDWSVIEDDEVSVWVCRRQWWVIVWACCLLLHSSPSLGREIFLTTGLKIETPPFHSSSAPHLCFSPRPSLSSTPHQSLSLLRHAHGGTVYNVLRVSPAEMRALMSLSSRRQNSRRGTKPIHKHMHSAPNGKWDLFLVQSH